MPKLRPIPRQEALLICILPVANFICSAAIRNEQLFYLRQDCEGAKMQVETYVCVNLLNFISLALHKPGCEACGWNLDPNARPFLARCNWRTYRCCSHRVMIQGNLFSHSATGPTPAVAA